MSPMNYQGIVLDSSNGRHMSYVRNQIRHKKHIVHISPYLGWTQLLFNGLEPVKLSIEESKV